ncbi:MAG TPA: nucleotidyltransferase family protein [Firmicutes bacterium]|nr:nucleotidyltransferase family protein [Bacillota bacterium]
MKAVILAAGRGTRLAELTKEVPKPMVPIGGRPCLARIITALHATGIGEIVIVTGYRADVIKAYFGDGAQMGVNITYVDQSVQSGTGSALHITRETVGDSSFVMTYGDILVPEENYAQMAQVFQKLRPQALLGLNWVEDPYRGAAVYLAENNRVAKIVEKPPQGTATTHWNNAGVFVFDPIIYQYTETLQLSPRGEYELPDAIQAMLQAGLAVYGYPLQGYWKDIGTPEDVRAAHRLVSDPNKN